MARVWFSHVLLPLALLAATAADAATVGLSLAIHTTGTTANVPQFDWVNDAETASIVRLHFAIGRTDRNFDAVYADDDGDGRFVAVIAGTDGTSGISYAVRGLDADTSGGLRSDVIDVAFAGFGPGLRFSLRADIDLDTRDTTEDFGTVFFNNGAWANAVVRAWFSDGALLDLTLPETPVDLNPTGGQRYVFSLVPGPPGAVSEPAVAWLCLPGLAALALRRRWRRPRLVHPVEKELPCTTASLS